MSESSASHLPFCRGAIILVAALVATAAHAQTGRDAQQPDWATPFVTFGPRITPAVRYDVAWRSMANGDMATVFGTGKGVEIIPTPSTQLIVALPQYTAHHDPALADGFGDTPLFLKYRVMSHNRDSGNDIFSVFIGGTLPTGGHANGAAHPVFLPTLAGGKGWGDFDLQSSAGINIPFAGARTLGHAIVYNLTAQDRVRRYFWPDVELNATSWPDGTRRGHTQLFATPGLIVGRLRFYQDLGVTFGLGEQIALTSYHQYDHGVLATFRTAW